MSLTVNTGLLTDKGQEQCVCVCNAPVNRDNAAIYEAAQFDSPLVLMIPANEMCTIRLERKFLSYDTKEAVALGGVYIRAHACL